MSGSRAWTDVDVRALRDLVGAAMGGPAEREAAEGDFGHLVRGKARAAVSPRSVDEVEQVVAFANARGLTLTPRGRGMSQGGQSLPTANGISLDLSRLVEIGAPSVESRTIHASAGATWRNVIAAAAPHGLLPKVVPLNLDLTVGGLLSVAGVGAASHTHGPAVACVAELDVVTGGGRRVTCSQTREPQVFHGVLGGLGRSGLIVGARVELTPYQPAVRTFYLLFDTVEGWVAAQRTLVAAGRADYLEGFCTPCVQGLRNGPRGRTPFAQWFYGLHITVEHQPGQPPDAVRILGGLGPHRLIHIEDDNTVGFAARYDPRFAAMRRSGAWALPHPWVEAMLPVQGVSEFLTSILEIYPIALGDGPRLLFVNRKNAPPFLRMPTGLEVACCAFLPVGIPSHILSDTLDTFTAIHDRIVESGGKRVLSGWTTMMNEAALAEHYGEQAGAWVETKRALDPRGVLDSPIAYSNRE